MTTDRTTAAPRFALVAGLAAGAVAGVLVALALAPLRPVPGVLEPAAVVRFGVPLVRVLLDLSATAVVGLSLLPRLLGFDRPARTEPVLALARPAAVVAAALWALSALVAIVLQAAETSPGQPVTTGLVLRYVRDVGGGQGLLATGVLALVSLGIAALAVRWREQVPAELRVAAALFGLLPLPVTGHASNWTYHDLTMITMELHVLSAAAWTGGLAALVALVAGRRGLLADALPRFSRLATLCLAVAAGTGLCNAAVELAISPATRLPGSLWTTGYGLVVLAKVACSGVLALVGARMRWWLLPRVARHQTSALVGWAALEVAVMGVAFGLAVVLSRTPVA